MVTANHYFQFGLQRGLIYLHKCT